MWWQPRLRRFGSDYCRMPIASKPSPIRADDSGVDRFCGTFAPARVIVDGDPLFTNRRDELVSSAALLESWPFTAAEKMSPPVALLVTGPTCDAYLQGIYAGRILPQRRETS
jgi:hypothetical protein